MTHKLYFNKILALTYHGIYVYHKVDKQLKTLREWRENMDGSSI